MYQLAGYVSAFLITTYTQPLRAQADLYHKFVKAHKGIDSPTGRGMVILPDMEAR